MLENIWNRILDFFSDSRERGKLLRTFNSSSRNAFVSGKVPTLLRASYSCGDSAYKHAFSNFLQHGFRVTALSGRVLKREELQMIGAAILSNEELVRKLVVLGFDTLEVTSQDSVYGCKWRLTALLQIEGS